MEQVLLAVFFLINGKATIVDGWEPRIQSTEKICLMRKELLEQQLIVMFGEDKTVVFCGTLDEIKRKFEILNSVDV